MKVEIKVPPMGESISEATVGAILKPTGSRVSQDDELLELETDKVNQVLYASQAGTFELKVSQGEVVKIGQVVGTIDSEGKGEQAPPKEEAKPKEEPKPQAQPEKKAEPAKKPEEKVATQPTQARSEIRETKETFLAELKSGPKKEEPKKEEPKAAPSLPAQTPQPPSAPSKAAEGRFTRSKLTKIRKVIGARLVEVQHSTAMLTTFNEVDMSAIIAIREKYKEPFMKQYGVKLGFMSFFVKAAVSALKEIPDFNSYIEMDELVHREFYDIGVAVGTDRGVIVPVIKNCDQLNFAEIEKALEQFAKKSREGTISIDDLQGGGFTITNGGVYGSLLSTPILNPMQSGILGMHKIEKRPVVINDEIVIRPMMYLALSYDHRIVDGKEAVTFLVHIKNCLEDPSRLLLEI